MEPSRWCKRNDMHGLVDIRIEAQARDVPYVKIGPGWLWVGSLSPGSRGEGCYGRQQTKRSLRANACASH
eukprot:7660323-Pyramimonas_sp.AAC.1